MAAQSVPFWPVGSRSWLDVLVAVFANATLHGMGCVHAASKSVPDVSVVIPSYNGRLVIERCLRSLLDSNAPFQFEIIVVDSSTDGAAALVKREFPEVRLIRSEERLSAGGARNVGAERSRGAIVAFIDQDCAAPADWLERLVDHFSDEVIDGVGGALSASNLGNLSGMALYFLEFMYHLPAPSQGVKRHPFLLGCNAAYRRDVLDTMPFPDQTMAEDVLFSFEASERGFHCVYDSSISVSHMNKSGWRLAASYLRRLGSASATYHRRLDQRRSRLIFSHPPLAFLVPLYILPSLAMRVMLTRRPAYIATFLLLLPACILGSLLWASGFYGTVNQIRRDATTGPALGPGRDDTVGRQSASALISRSRRGPQSTVLK